MTPIYMVQRSFILLTYKSAQNAVLALGFFVFCPKKKKTAGLQPGQRKSLFGHMKTWTNRGKLGIYFAKCHTSRQSGRGSQQLHHDEHHFLPRPNHQQRPPLCYPGLCHCQAGVMVPAQPRAGRLRLRCADNGLRQRLRTPAGSLFGPEGVRGLCWVLVSRGKRSPKTGPRELQSPENPQAGCNQRERRATGKEDDPEEPPEERWGFNTLWTGESLMSVDAQHCHKNYLHFFFQKSFLN